MWEVQGGGRSSRPAILSYILNLRPAWAIGDLVSNNNNNNSNNNNSLSLVPKTDSSRNPCKNGPAGPALSHVSAQSPKGRCSGTENLSFFKLWFGVGVETEFTMIFFTSPDGLQKNLCAFIFAHSSGSDLLYNYVTFYLLRRGISSSATSRGFLAGPCDAVTQGLSSQRCRNQKEKRNGRRHSENKCFRFLFSPFPILLYSFNLPE